MSKKQIVTFLKYKDKSVEIIGRQRLFNKDGLVLKDIFKYIEIRAQKQEIEKISMWHVTLIPEYNPLKSKKQTKKIPKTFGRFKNCLYFCSIVINIRRWK